MKSIAFFNNKGGVGKTALVYHLAHMFAEQGVPTLAVDLDPQANLSTMCVDEDRIAALWHEEKTFYTAFAPILRGVGDVEPAFAEELNPNLHLLVGDLRLSSIEDTLSDSWTKTLGGEERAFRIMSGFHRIITETAQRLDKALVLIDLGPNLGALNRTALLSSESLIVPVAPDLFSIQGLKNLGPTLIKWRRDWTKRLQEAADIRLDNLDLPQGTMDPLGYVVMSFGVRDNRPVKAYNDYMTQIPTVFAHSVRSDLASAPTDPSKDLFCLASLKHYRSLMPLAMTARKPMFSLKTADGAIGSHLEAVRKCHDDFFALAQAIGVQIHIPI